MAWNYGVAGGGGINANVNDEKIKELMDLLVAKSLELAQLQKTHDEYVASSCEYERELEVEVDRYEKKTQQLVQALDKVEHDKQVLLAKLETTSADLVAAATREEALQANVVEMKWKIQRLEQTNDELETAARVARASIENLEHHRDRLMEQTVFLQHDKEELHRELSAALSAVTVHPMSPRTMSLNASSARFSTNQSSTVLIEVAATTLDAESPRNQRIRAKGRYPDVVESCLHLTCRQCSCARPMSLPVPDAGEKKPRESFLDRLMLKMFCPSDVTA